jgi:peptidoglycan/LPS O-acetylase OafA/YrhL
MQLNSKKIDVLKGISILLVFAYHALLTLQSQQRTHPSFSFSSGILDVSSLSKKDWLIFISPYSYGFAGVQFFLLISGFLIHLSFLNSRKGFSVKVSFWKRFWRIYPPYLFVLLFFVLFFDSAQSLFDLQGIKNIVYHLLLIHNLDSTTIFQYNSSFWSLALEVQLYLLYPLVLILREKIGMKNILWLAFLIFGLSVL